MRYDPELSHRCYENRVELLRIFLELGITFARLTHEAHTPEAAFRMSVCARRCYDTVLRFLEVVPLTPADADELGSKLYSLDYACHTTALHLNESTEPNEPGTEPAPELLTTGGGGGAYKTFA